MASGAYAFRFWKRKRLRSPATPKPRWGYFAGAGRSTTYGASRVLDDSRSANSKSRRWQPAADPTWRSRISSPSLTRRWRNISDRRIRSCTSRRALSSTTRCGSYLRRRGVLEANGRAAVRRDLGLSFDGLSHEPSGGLSVAAGAALDRKVQDGPAVR